VPPVYPIKLDRFRNFTQRERGSVFAGGGGGVLNLAVHQMREVKGKFGKLDKGD